MWPANSWFQWRPSHSNRYKMLSTTWRYSTDHQTPDTMDGSLVLVAMWYSRRWEQKRDHRQHHQRISIFVCVRECRFQGAGAVHVPPIVSGKRNFISRIVLMILMIQAAWGKIGCWYPLAVPTKQGGTSVKWRCSLAVFLFRKLKLKLAHRVENCVLCFVVHKSLKRLSR
jgi:hypothetical protein